jgi:hypothetical protein
VVKEVKEVKEVRVVRVVNALKKLNSGCKRGHQCHLKTWTLWREEEMAK